MFLNSFQQLCISPNALLDTAARLQLPPQPIKIEVMKPSYSSDNPLKIIKVPLTFDDAGN